MQARESQIIARQNTTTAIKNKVTHKAYFPIFLFIYFLLVFYFLFNKTNNIKSSNKTIEIKG